MKEMHKSGEIILDLIFTVFFLVLVAVGLFLSRSLWLPMVEEIPLLASFLHLPPSSQTLSISKLPFSIGTIKSVEIPAVPQFHSLSNTVTFTRAPVQVTTTGLLPQTGPNLVALINGGVLLLTGLFLYFRYYRRQFKKRLNSLDIF